MKPNKNPIKRLLAISLSCFAFGFYRTSFLLVWSPSTYFFPPTYDTHKGNFAWTSQKRLTHCNSTPISHFYYISETIIFGNYISYRASHSLIFLFVAFLIPWTNGYHLPFITNFPTFKNFEIWSFIFVIYDLFLYPPGSFCSLFMACYTHTHM